MKPRILILFLGLFISAISFSQELNCQVTINTDQIQGTTEKQIFEQLKKSIFEFMNNTKWTNDVFTSQERIDCSILIVIQSKVTSDDYQATIQVQSRRPVFKSSYYTPVFNYEDDNFLFQYQQFTTLDFNQTTFQNNLTSVLAFYAYVILAVDYDSFAPLGGTQYWQKAQTILNNAQSAPSEYKGWRSNEGNKNRYWLIENTLQPVFQGIRDCLYQYSMNGLDIMNEKPDDGRANVMKALELLKPVYAARPASFNMQLFFNAKRDEIINIFKSATPEEKTKITDLLMQVDPANTTKYMKIQG
ncbi:MAG: type IX secretion system protein PorD [Bacteroidia bacterium]